MNRSLQLLPALAALMLCGAVARSATAPPAAAARRAVPARTIAPARAPSPVIPQTPSPPFQQVDPVVRKLSNGLTVAVFPSKRLPIVQMELLVPAGISAEPAGANGVAYLTAQLIRRGSTSRDAARFAADVERLGGSITSGASRDYATVNGAFLARDFTAGLELLSDAALNPIFPDEELRNTRVQAVRSLSQLHSDPSSTADEQAWSLAFGDHPYGRPPYGTESSILALTRDQIRTFYRDRYRPTGAMLAIAGDVTPDEAFAAAEDRFGRWVGTAAAIPSPALPGDGPSARRPIRIVDMPEATATELRLALLLPGRASEDDLPLTLGATLFGGGDDTGLRGPEVRRMLGNNVRGTILTLRDGGLFTVATPVRTDSAAAATEFLRRQFREFVKNPPGDAEFAPIRRVAIDTYSLPLETLGGQMGQWLALQYLGLPSGSQDGAPRRLATLNATDLGAALRRWFDPDRISIVAVGPAEKLRRVFEALGPVEVVQPLAPPLAPVFRDTAEATPERQARARELLHAALEAHGGEQALRDIHDSEIHGKITILGTSGGMGGDLTQIRKDPLRMLVVTTFLSLETRQGLDVDRSWTTASGTAGIQDGDSLQLAGLRGEFRSDLPHVLLGAIEPGVRATYRGPDRIDGREVDGIDLVDGRGARSRILLDSKTHMLVALERYESVVPGSFFTARRIYRDYRPVQKLQWPFEEERSIEGRSAMRVNISEVRLNLGIGERIFARPAETGSGP